MFLHVFFLSNTSWYSANDDCIDLDGAELSFTRVS